MALIAAVLLVLQGLGGSGRSAAHVFDRYGSSEPQIRVSGFCAIDSRVGHTPRPHDPADCPDNCCLIGGDSSAATVVPEIGSARPAAPSGDIGRAPGSAERRLTRIAGWASTWSASGPPSDR